MSDTITVPRVVLEQALEAFRQIAWSNDSEWQADCANESALKLRAALEQPQVEQPQVEQPVAWIEHEWSGSGLRHLHFERPAPTVRDEVVCPVWTPLYTHPQNLNCKSTQARLATLWGYEKPQPSRQPLTDAEILMVLDAADIPDLPRDFEDVDIDIARAIEAAHGIGGEK